MNLDERFEALEALETMATGRVQFLRIKAAVLRTRRRYLAFISGILAILAALSISSFFSDIVGSYGSQAAAAVLAFASGVVSLYVPIFVENDFEHLLDGVGEWEEYRTELGTFLLSGDDIPTDAFKEYGLKFDRLSSKYDRYIMAKINEIDGNTQFEEIGGSGDE